MKLAKKFTSVLLAAMLFAFTATGCTGNNQGGAASSEAGQPEVSSSLAESSEASSEPSSAPAEKTQIRIAAIKGPTGLGMLKLMSDAETGGAANDYQFELVSDPNEVVAKISTGEIDAAAVPTNLAATLYNKTEGNVQLAALNTLGVLYIVTNGEEIASVEDLKGKTIYSSGQGSVPEYALNYILQANGLEPGKDVMVEYKTEHTELASLLIAGDISLAMLPEPFVTQVTAKNPEIKVVLDMTEEWDKAVDSKSVLTMGCVIVRKDFAEKNQEAFNKFLEEYQASVAYTNEETEAASKLSEQFDIMPAAVAQKAIPNCNIVYLDGAEMKEKVADFLNVLFEANPKSIGGKLPGEDFYYAK